MSKRTTVSIAPVEHAAPIPMAVKIGNMLFSSAIMGADPATGTLADDLKDQARFAFENVRSVMKNAGGSCDDIAHMTVFLKDLSYKDAVNEQWFIMFPDENDRPARHSIQADLPGTMLVQLEIVAVI